ncbi:MAG: ATP-binding cassette domain-containing protein [Streptosporangiales bacterium]|nr:ATP-binding cassette domain-containing protein [Streptosporangiales bacterium]
MRRRTRQPVLVERRVRWLGAVPRGGISVTVPIARAPDGPADQPDDGPLLEVTDLVKHFPVRRGPLARAAGQVRAVDGVSFTVNQAETLGLVGESGCGKTTIGRLVLRLLLPTGGRVRYAGRNLSELPGRDVKEHRQRLQIIFQDPFSSLDPRMKVGRIIGEGLDIHGIGSRDERRRWVEQLLRQVGLSPSDADRFPHQFSGGQRQRIGIARALATNPEFVVCDEPVSALDVSIQAQIINLLRDLQQQRGLSYLFVSHDLNLVRYIADRVCVMYLGEIVETADTEELFANPLHPYTKALLSSVPQLHASRSVRDRVELRGEVPSPANPPSGCRFHPRCPHATPRSAEVRPRLTEMAPGHAVAACPCFT